MDHRCVPSRRRLTFVSALALGLSAACGSASHDPGGSERGPEQSGSGDPLPEPGPTPSPPPNSIPATPNDPAQLRPLAECSAQRVVHLVAGVGGLAWFTQLWPAPAVITGYQSTYSFDDPNKAASVGTAAHPLFVRLDGPTTPLWQKSGAHPYPTAFVAGINLTHTMVPVTTQLAGTDVIAAGAAAQKSLAPALPVLSFQRAGLTLSYGPASFSPPATAVADVDAAISALKASTTISPALEQELRPSATTLATWYPADAPATVKLLAQHLLFTANLFRHGLVGTVLIPALDDDPHGAWAIAGTVTTRADTLTRILDSFYAELATSNEPSCGVAGKRLNLADNTLLVASGDTPKNSFDNAGWADGTPNNANFMYVRSNGFLQPGWFGSVTKQGKTEFDPKTGALAPSGTWTASQTAALQGLLWAITRGDANAVSAVSTAAFDGIVAKP